MSKNINNNPNLEQNGADSDEFNIFNQPYSNTVSPQRNDKYTRQSVSIERDLSSGQDFRNTSIGSTDSDREFQLFSPSSRLSECSNLSEKSNNNKTLLNKEVLMSMLVSWQWVFFSITCTLYALFADDARMACSPQNHDAIFLVFNCIVGFLFLIELFLFCYVDFHYIGSTYMMLDTFALLSLISDIVILSLELTGHAGTINAPTSDFRAARTARIASRVGRLMRALRLLSAVKAWIKERYSSEPDDEVTSRVKTLSFTDAEDKSRFGKYLTTAVTKKVILISFLMVIVIPLLDTNQTEEALRYIRTTVDNVKLCYDEDYVDLCPNEGDKLRYLKKYIFTYGHDYATKVWPEDEQYYPYKSSLKSYKLVFISIKDETENNQSLVDVADGSSTLDLEGSSAVENLRYSEKLIYTLFTDDRKVVIEAIFDKTFVTQKQGILSIYQTLFLIVVSVIGSATLHADTVNHVIIPVQNMLESVKKLAGDPLHFWDQNKSLVRCSVLESAEVKKKKSSLPRLPFKEPGEKNNEHEVHELHNYVCKIAELLAVGFGRAGWSIIRSAILRARSVEWLLPGRKMHGIFMFNFIRDFDALSDCLQEDIVELVNAIATVVHEKVSQYNGSTNKNLGDCYLSAWTFPNKVTMNSRLVPLKNLISDDMYGQAPKEVSFLADRSFIGSIKILLGILKNQNVKNLLKKHEEVLAKKLPGYKVSVGFGLHVGWAIEGAIGSKHKIDASYLSANVNIAARIQSATTIFGVDILLSGNYVNILSASNQRLCRMIDRVSVKGSAKVVELFTIDFPENPNEYYDKYIKNKVQSPEEILISKAEQVHKWRHSHISTERDYRTDETFKMVKYYQTTLKKFYDVWEEAFSLYRNGDWKRAYTWFEKALAEKPNDGPTKTLMKVLERENFSPAANFKVDGRSLKRKC